MSSWQQPRIGTVQPRTMIAIDEQGCLWTRMSMDNDGHLPQWPHMALAIDNHGHSRSWSHTTMPTDNHGHR